MVIRFLDYLLDAADARLRRGEQIIPLRPKTLAVLQHLAERAGRLVTTDELLDAVWSDAVVGETSLRSSIKELRSVFDDDARQPRIIETVHRHGYRFIAPVHAEGQGAVLRTRAPSDDGVRLVGRDAELGILEDSLRRAVDGERQVVFVGGEPGIGKTSLVEAFLQRVPPTVLVATGQCVEQHGADEPYLPVLEGLGRLCAGPEGAAIVTLLRRHAPSWLAQLPDVIDAAEHEALQRRLGGTTPHAMLREVASFVAALPTPVVLVLEDLHWSDRATLDVLSLLAQRRDRAPLLVVVTFRPIDVVLREHPLGAVHRELQARRCCRDLWMSYLGVDAIAGYLEARWPGLTDVDRHAHAIHAHTDGNPLFMVSFLDHLVESGAVACHDGQWTIADVAVGVPHGLRQSIDSHIERIAPQDRDALEAGSLVGRRFPAALAAAALGADTVDVEQRLGRLARREQLVRASGETMWPDGSVSGSYELTHSLYQHALRERVTPARRRQLHQRIGERLEAGYGLHWTEVAAELAFHFEASGDLDRAIACLEEGAERSIRRAGQRDAAAQLERAIALVERLPRTSERILQTIRLLHRLGTALTDLNNVGDAGAQVVFTRCRELADETNDVVQLFRALLTLTVSYIASGKLALAAEAVERLDVLRQEMPFPIVHFAADVVTGLTRYHHVRLVDARIHLEAALASADLPIPEVSFSLHAVALSYLALALMHLGFPDQARVRSRQARERTVSGSPQDQAQAAAFACMLHHGLFRCAGLLPVAENAVRIGTTHGIELATTVGMAYGAFARIADGDAAGLADARAAIRQYRSYGQLAALPNLLASLVLTCLDAGHLDDATHALAEARAASDATDERIFRPELDRLEGELLLARGDVEGAEACFRRAVVAAEAQGTRSWELRARLSLARLCVERGRRDAVPATLRPIVDVYTEGADLPDVQAAHALLGESDGA